MNLKTYSCISRKIKVLVAGLSLSLLVCACSTRNFAYTDQNSKTKLKLESTNFEMSVVHAVGEASCFYFLFGIPLCRDNALATAAWEEMRNKAKLDGKSAQLINVFEDQSLRWNFFYIFYEEYYTVTANVIEFK